MLRASLKKIKSALEPTLGGLAILLAVIAVSFWVLALVAVKNSKNDSTVVLKTDTKTYYLNLANTPQLQEKGLGVYKALAAQSGMIFPYHDEAERCFWMKGMQFPIDIIWVSNEKKVTHIESDVSPATYPKEYCYMAQYVIELNAGESQKGGILTGTELDF